MPIYEYNCRHCNRQFDELIRGEEKVHCPNCGGDHLERKMSVCGLVSSSKFTGGSVSSSCGGCSSHSCSGCSGK